MRRRCVYLPLALIFALLTVAPACRKKPAEPTPADEPRETATETQPPRDTRPDREQVREEDFGGEPDDAGGEGFGEATISVGEMHDRLRTVYFAYDSYELSPTSLATLRENAEVLKAYRQFGVVVEGHCDERGTIDYNLALGEKRAASVRDYLTSLGVERERIRIITYGEERPTDPGHTEAAWSKNRRSEFVVER